MMSLKLIDPPCEKQFSVSLFSLISSRHINVDLVKWSLINKYTPFWAGSLLSVVNSVVLSHSKD